jgi:CRP-like cAMP-binding protein
MGFVTENSPSNSILDKLSQTDQSYLQQYATHKSFKKGDIIVHYGDTWPFLALVTSGTINVVKLSTEGRKLGGLRLHAGDEFWSPSLFDGEPLPAALEAWESGSITIWHRDLIIPLIKKDADILWELTLLLIKRTRQASGFVEGLTFRPVAGRLAQLLLKEFEGTTGDRLMRHLSLDEMGSIIGTTPVMVCKQLYRFAENGLINVSRTEFQLTDQTGLEKIAGL